MAKGVRTLLKTLSPKIIDHYTNYIYSIKPQNNDDILRRWLFAFCSIHTTWENNVSGYTALKDLGWFNRESYIRARLKYARTGLHNVRANHIYNFTARWKKSSDRYSFKGRNFKVLRNKLSSELKGIGLAKVSFAAELINPDAGVICLDRHVLRWMTGGTELNGKMSVRQYEELEQRWKKACREYKYHPVAARHALWDINQGKTDMRYWSQVLEQ